MDIRVSIGTVAALQLERIITDTLPTTAYLMQFFEGHCLANCSFCPQATDSSSKRNKLSRVLWPKYELQTVIDRLKKKDSGIKRICIQTMLFDESEDQLIAILNELKKNNLNLPISICSYPTDKVMFEKLKELGATRIGISYDCATPELFEKIKGKSKTQFLSWEILDRAIEDAIDVFGARFVSTHLIIGLGETEQEALSFIQKLVDKKITIGLFAFTPVKGTLLENEKQPQLDSYRRIQLGKYLIEKKLTSLHKIKFSSKEEHSRVIDYGFDTKKILDIIESGKPFVTSGCSHCNRPYYNESPGKQLYNYPRPLTEIQTEKIKKYFKDFLKANKKTNK
jgi:biotin synthase